MNDDIDQLLKNLQLRRLREIISDELERAEKKKPSYTEFIARVVREEYQHQQERFLEYRIDRANIPERWTLETFPVEGAAPCEARRRWSARCSIGYVTAATRSRSTVTHYGNPRTDAPR